MVGTVGKRFFEWAQSWRVFVLMSIWLILWAGLHLVPAEWWFEVKYVQVQDTAPGAEVQLLVDREIKREFYGKWSVQVRKAKGGAGWETIPCGYGANTYRTNSLLPTPLTLDWWTEGKCATLPPGRYQISTQWIIYPGKFWPEKTVSVLSNVFEVKDGAAPMRQD